MAKLNKVVIDPDPPQKGKDIKVTANVTTCKKTVILLSFVNSFSFFPASTVTGGSIKIEVKWGFLKVVDQTVQVCDVLKESNLKCPLSAGTYSASQTVSLPSETPGVSHVISCPGLP